MRVDTAERGKVEDGEIEAAGRGGKWQVRSDGLWF